MNKKGINFLTVGGEASTYCTLPCIKEQQKECDPTKGGGDWHTDAGPKGICSMKCLLDWMQMDPNYSRWKGDDDDSGETKGVLATEIAELIKEAGVIVTRMPHAVRAMICQLESGFQDAFDWLDCSGNGCDENTIEYQIHSRCKYFDELYDIMIDRNSTHPLLTDYLDYRDARKVCPFFGLYVLTYILF